MHGDPILLLASALEAPTVSIIVLLIELTMLCHPGLLNRYWFLTWHYFPYIDPDHDFFAPWLIFIPNDAAWMNRIDNSAEELSFCIACRLSLPDVLRFYLDKGHNPNLWIKIRNREDVGTREISPLALSVVYTFSRPHCYSWNGEPTQTGCRLTVIRSA